MGRGVVIKRVKVGKKVRAFKKGKKTRLRYPSQMGGYITRTYVSRKAAKAGKRNLGSWAQSRAKITPVKK